jgi:hypothetical protein
MKTFTVALLATVVMAWDHEPVLHSHYSDIQLTRGYTQDATENRTISDVKQRQVPRYYDHTTVSTVYDDQVENRTRDVLVTNPTIKQQQVNSTSYSTEATMGTQDRTRFDVVQQERDTKIDSFQTNDKLVNIIDSEVAYDEVTTTRDNFITINKLCDSSRVVDVTTTELHDQIENVNVTRTRPVSMTTLVDQIIEEDVEVTNLVSQIILEDVEVTNLVDQIVLSNTDTEILVDTEVLTDVQETILVDVVKSREVAGTKVVTETSYKLKDILVHTSSSDSCGDWNDWCNGKSGHGHKVITKKIPTTISKTVPTTRIENYTVQVPQTITSQVSKTVQRVEVVSKQTSRTIQVPVTSTEQREKTIQVPVTSIEKRQKTIQVPVTTVSQEEYTVVEQVTVQVPVEVTR